ncbi:MAG: TetR/AcrR family transcriptional regulator [Acidobacteriota bacterium]|nr:TetR/AcrR family transcriptional regulator [Acidobacteriota bacterium]
MKSKKSGGLGRPRSFETGKALDSALQVFWRKGYEGASLTDLTTTMGINRPSLYATFGDKQSLFRKVLDRYTEGPAAHARKALQQPTSRAVVESLLCGTVDLLTCPQNPKGCLLVQGALACGSAADSIRKELVSRRLAGQSELRRRLKQAKAEGDLPPDANTADLARYILTVIHGLAVQATGGATRADLQHVVRIVLQSWPPPKISP